jgi:A/G-specific adenine glycosylase
LSIPLDRARVPGTHQALLDWYARAGRDLPWRRTRDPYAVLVAEVMLQQTQVDRVMPRWHAWLARFPGLQELAQASRADVIRAWQGLGYNLRAVRLHEVAQQVMAEHAGKLPASLPALLRLKGVGRYTAGAIACFAFELPVAVVDTNVRRVLGRAFLGSSDLSPRAAQDLADAVLPADNAWAWQQALMDLGATVCRAERPLCLVCPLLSCCSAAGEVPIVKLRRTPVERFETSERYYRGRIVDAVRSAGPDGHVAVSQLAVVLALSDDRMSSLVKRLQRDGLIRQIDTERVALPD